jgi:DNA-binding transcriptional ArsR family regulator
MLIELEMILASSCRRRILRVLYKLGRVNVMMLVRKVNSTYSQVNPNLQILEKEGIVTEEHLGHKRIIKLNRENDKTEVLLQVLKIFERFRNNKKIV